MSANLKNSVADKVGAKLTFRFEFLPSGEVKNPAGGLEPKAVEDASEPFALCFIKAGFS